MKLSKMPWPFMTSQEIPPIFISWFFRYFSMQATSPIEIGAPLRVELESDICTEDGRPKENAFHTCKRICINRLQDKYLRKFVASESYLRYILDLRTSIENTVSIFSELEISVAIPDRFTQTKWYADSKWFWCAIVIWFVLYNDVSCTPESIRGKDISIRCFIYKFYAPSIDQNSTDSKELVRQFICIHILRDIIRIPTSKRFIWSCPWIWKRWNFRNLAEIDDLGRYRPLYDDSLAQDGATPSKYALNFRNFKTTNSDWN